MKILKKSLAALLSVILLATCANLSAVVSVAEASGTRMEAEDQGENINLYGTHNDITWQSGRGIVVTSNADYTKGTLPTYEGLNDGSYTAEDLATDLDMDWGFRCTRRPRCPPPAKRRCL